MPNLINKIFKAIIRKIFPFQFRQRIFWKLQTLKFALATPLAARRSPYACRLAEEFNDWFRQFDAVEKLETINNLTRGLEADSVARAKEFISRQDYTLKHNWLEQTKLFSAEELTEQAECSRIIDKLRTKFSKYNLQISPEVAYGQSGLKWLPAAIKSRLNQGVFVDVGAYDGDSALIFYEVFKPRIIYAFEPENNNFLKLKKNALILGDNIIKPIKLGLSEAAKNLNISNNNNGSRLNNESAGEEISLVALDEFFSQAPQRAEPIDLIKMDIEGEEMAALCGAEKIIKQYQPVLAISIYHRIEDFFLIKPYLEKVCPNYKFIIKKANPFELSRETMLLAYPEEI
ncbi:MAG: FkbM family methyltransferase [Candidatus Falkowbacteria bacterium]|nr:FkbM family methyltransferase [Candidatus Falkowbacteria bacterium]